MAGNADPSPSTDTVFVTGGPACAPPTVSPTVSSNVTETTAEVDVPFDDHGAAGTARIAYGPTAGYGTEVTESFVPRELTPEEITMGAKKELRPILSALDPGTLYHYRVTVTTPFGTASSADQTFTTKPASGPLPTMFYGVPIPGRYVASLPATIDVKGVATDYSVLIDTKGPINPGAPVDERPAARYRQPPSADRQSISRPSIWNRRRPTTTASS